MKILYLINQGLMTPDLAISLSLYGYELDILENYECPYDMVAPECQNKIEDMISRNKYEFVISYNFIPSASYICNKHNIKYVAWMYDVFQAPLYKEYINYSCNRIFVFDSFEYMYLKQLGIQNIYYLPLCANDIRLNEILITRDDEEKYKNEVSLVGRLYCNDQSNGYANLINNIEASEAEKIDRIISNSVGRWQSEDDWVSKILKLDISQYPELNSQDKKDGCLMDERIRYINLIFARELTRRDRTLALNRISQYYKTTIYSYEKPIGLNENVIIKNGVDYVDEMPKVFALSKINLNFTLRSIVRGIPLRCFDVLSAGGFLMSNYQDDMDKLFVDGKDYVSFNSIEDMLDKVQYYLLHDEEREVIRKSGEEKAKNHHNFMNRIDEITKVILRS